MKRNHGIELAFFIFIFSLKVNSQQKLVQTPKDILFLCRDEERFLGKPLGKILNEIKPSIKYAFGAPGEGVRPNVFYFFFVPRNIYFQYRQQDKFPLTLRVYVKEDFEWYESRQKLEKSKRHEWSKADEKKYENLTITKVSIGGEFNACDYEIEQNL